MSKVKEILRLKFDVGLSLRDIAASCNCGKSTVDDILKRAQNANVSWPCDLNDNNFCEKHEQLLKQYGLYLYLMEY